MGRICFSVAKSGVVRGRRSSSSSRLPRRGVHDSQHGAPAISRSRRGRPRSRPGARRARRVPGAPSRGSSRSSRFPRGRSRPSSSRLDEVHDDVREAERCRGSTEPASGTISWGIRRASKYRAAAAGTSCRPARAGRPAERARPRGRSATAGTPERQLDGREHVFAGFGDAVASDDAGSRTPCATSARRRR